MKNFLYIPLVAFAVALSTGCSYNPPEPANDPTQVKNPSAGDADFSRFVAVGNSLTAGFMDGALYDEGQKNSYPALMAQSMATVNGGKPFNQPDINSQFGYLSQAGGLVLGRIMLVKPACNKQDITPAPSLQGALPGVFTGDKKNLNNFAVPGILLGQVLIPQTGGPAAGANSAYNPLYGRFASNPGVSTIIGDAVAANPTFFVFALGNNDVLGYALSAGSKPGLLTSEAAFRQQYTTAINLLLNAPAKPKGVVSTIPDVSAIPFFSVVSSRITPFALDAATAAQLNGLYQLRGLGNPNFTAGSNNNFVIATSAGTVRQYRPGKDFLIMTIPTDSLGMGTFTPNPCNPQATGRRAGWGVTSPIGNEYVLDEDEVAIVKARTVAFNNIIREIVTAANTQGKRVALFDSYTYFNKVAQQGDAFNTTRVTPALPFGGFMSMDGVHPTQRGYAFIANEFLKVINKEFNARLPLVDPGKYEANQLPQ